MGFFYASRPLEIRLFGCFGTQANSVAESNFVAELSAYYGDYDSLCRCNRQTAGQSLIIGAIVKRYTDAVDKVNDKD